MKTASKLVLGLSMALVVGLLARAEDKKDGESKSGKEVTLMGTITCAKCDLKLQKSCNTVVKVTKDGKDTIYYFDKDSNKKYHKDTCTEAKDGTVTGTVTTKDDKSWITVTKLEYK
jgi:RecG-like helicase